MKPHFFLIAPLFALGLSTGNPVPTSAMDSTTLVEFQTASQGKANETCEDDQDSPLAGCPHFQL